MRLFLAPRNRLATVNPLAKDAGQTNTTLGYAAPLREAVGMFGLNRKKKGAQKRDPMEDEEAAAAAVVFEVDARDPVLWDAAQARADAPIATDSRCDSRCDSHATAPLTRAATSAPQ